MSCGLRGAEGEGMLEGPSDASEGAARLGPDGGVQERGVKTRERDTCEVTGRERRKRGAGRLPERD